MTPYGNPLLLSHMPRVANQLVAASKLTRELEELRAARATVAASELRAAHGQHAMTRLHLLPLSISALALGGRGRRSNPDPDLHGVRS